MMEVPTKDTVPADNGSDMLAAHQALFGKKDEADKDEADAEPEKAGAEAEAEKSKEGDKLDLDDRKDGDDIEVWKANKERGVAKLVERTKAKEADLDAKIKDTDAKAQDARFYLDNRADIHSVLGWMRKAADKETFDEAIAELRFKVYGEEFKPEHDSEAALAKHLDSKYQARIDALTREVESIKGPIAAESKAREAKDALDKKAEDTYDTVALAIAATCNGYQVDKEKYRQSVLANPALDGEEAVRKHLFSEILAHTATVASGTKPKKREIIDSSASKDAAPPAGSDMAEHYAYLKEAGVLTK